MELVKAEELTKHFGKATAVERISFTLPEGRCTALLGPNGAGKTTTLKMLSGLLQPTGGSIRFHGGTAGKDIRSLIGYLPQYPAFYGWMTGREYLEYVGRLAYMTKRDAKDRAAELLQWVGLAEAKNRRIAGYSGGMKQRLGIAQALIHRPRLLILDEPVSALDPIGRREVLELIRHMKLETTILFSTHVLHDAEEVSDDVLIMRAGKIAVSGSLEQLRKQGRQPLVIVEGDGSLEPWGRGLSERLGEWIESAEVSGTSARLVVRDMDKAKLALMADLVAHQVPVRKFAASETSLEDLFMKVAGA